MAGLTLIELATGALRDPNRVVDGAGPDDLSHLAPRALAIAVAGAVVLGVTVGSYRGGIQLAYAGVKTPFLLLVPLVVALPAVRAVYRAVDVDVAWTRLALAGLVGAARTGVLALAAAPVLWLLFSVRPDYHVSVLVFAGAISALGVPGLLAVQRALPAGGGWGRLAAGAASVAILGLVFAQTGWLLRPFVARPRAEVALLRPIEEDVFSSLEATVRASLGSYDWDARPSGAVDAWRGERQ